MSRRSEGAAAHLDRARARGARRGPMRLKGTAVEEFARHHDDGTAGEERYRALIPLEAPAPGQQYAFEVDLDACTGCKACVTGCHNMNGLDDGEVWRSVGVLRGGTASLPVLKTVTAACHHCV